MTVGGGQKGWRVLDARGRWILVDLHVLTGN